MTKPRPPVSIEQALTDVGSLLTWARAAEIIGCKERALRNWSDPDMPEQISLRDAIKLDVACLAAQGVAPLQLTYELLLENAAEIACADSRRLASETAAVAKESGEALSSLIVASQPGASPADKAIAARQAEEAITALTRTLPHLGVETPRGPEVPPPLPIGPAPA